MFACHVGAIADAREPLIAQRADVRAQSDKSPTMGLGSAVSLDDLLHHGGTDFKPSIRFLAR